MSHTSSISAIKITSISALQAAVTELQQRHNIRCALVANATPRAYFPNQSGMGQADYVLQLQDAKYDIGFYKDKDGAYEARTDFWGQHVEKILGAKATDPAREQQAKLGKLFQSYGVHAAMEAARKQGHQVRRVEGKDGAVRLEVYGPNL